MVSAKIEVIKKLPTTVNKNTSQQSSYEQGIISQPKCTFCDSVLICLVQARRAIYYWKTSVLCTYQAVYLYTRIYHSIWSMKATDRCILKEGSADSSHGSIFTRACQHRFQIVHIYYTAPRHQQQDSKSRALCRGRKTYLKVVRWQRNDETLGTATEGQQKVLGHPPPARTALSASLYWYTHLKINQETEKSSKRTGHWSRAEWCSAQHMAVTSLNVCKHQNHPVPIFQVFKTRDKAANNKYWTVPDAQRWILQNLSGHWLPGKFLLCLRERISWS